MSYTRVIKFTRPSVNVPFFLIPPSVLKHYTTKYGITGKRVVAPDDLSFTVTDVFASKVEYDNFLVDPIFVATKQSMTTHNASVGITYEVTLPE